MEIVKKTLPVEDAQGWHLLQNECRHFTEDEVDESNGEIISVERSEVIIAKGVCLTAIDISTLKENGIENIRVSNIPLKGNRLEEQMNLWETSLKIRGKRGEKKKTYIVTAESPTTAETFISDYLEVNVECTFEAIKVSKLDYNKTIKLYDTEREEYEADGNHRTHWYKSQIFATIQDGNDEADGSNKNILVQATDFEAALKAIKTVMGRSEYDVIYNAFKSMQELNIEEVFIPDESVSYYSNSEI